MLTRDIAPLLASVALIGLSASGCILESARRDGARCSEANTCPPGQQCSNDGQCLYPCPQIGCQDSECGCGDIDRGQDNGQMPTFSGWECRGDGLCHYTCGTLMGDPDAGVQGQCSGYMSCDTSRMLCLPACSDDSQCANGAKCFEPGSSNPGGGTPPNYCVGTGNVGDGGVGDGGDGGGPLSGYQTNYYSAGANPTALAVGGFSNGGAYQDIIVLSQADGTAHVFLGQGGGDFFDAGDTGVCTRPFWVAQGQIDNNGVTDLVLLGRDDPRIDVRAGDGAGGFVYVWQPNTLPWIPTAAALARFDYGGLGDLVAVSKTESMFVTAFSDGTGLMNIKPAAPTPAAQPVAVAVADVSIDGRDDVILVTESDNGLHVLFSNGDGSFALGGSMANVAGPGGGTPVAVVAGIFDFGPRIDFAIALKSHGADAIKVVFNWPDTSFYGGGIPDTANFTFLFTGDFDGDGALDLGALAPRVDMNTDVVLFRNEGNGQFATGRRFTLEGLAAAAAVGRFNGDECDDVAVAITTGDQLAVMTSKTCPPWQL